MGVTATIRAIAALLGIIIVAGGLWYVMNLKADLVQARENAAKLEQGIKDQQVLMAQMKIDVEAIQKANRELNETTERLRGEAEALSRKFKSDAQGNARDFGVLARERPDLVQRLVNRGTRAAMRCLELASGAPHTKEELEAKSANEINRECPSIANPNYKPLAQ